MALTVVRSGAEEDRDVAHAWARASLPTAMIDEIFAQATDEQARSFFTSVGARLAAANPLPDNDSLPELENAMNAAWQGLGLGRVALTMAADGIAIDHRGYSDIDTAWSQWWAKAAQALLFGAYDAWFGAIGGSASLQLRLVARTSESIQLHYGL